MDKKDLSEIVQSNWGDAQLKDSFKNEVVLGNEQPTEQEDILRSPTFGEKLVGLTFNPSGNVKVTRAKQLCAELADLLEDVNKSQESSYLGNTFYGGAIRRILDAQMWSVKFLTNKY